jgi:hypothetical protein
MSSTDCLVIACKLEKKTAWCLQGRTVCITAVIALLHAETLYQEGVCV